MWGNRNWRTRSSSGLTKVWAQAQQKGKGGGELRNKVSEPLLNGKLISSKYVVSGRTLNWTAQAGSWVVL